MSKTHESYDAQREACKGFFANTDWVKPAKPRFNRGYVSEFSAVGLGIYKDFSAAHMEGKADALPWQEVSHGFKLTGRGIGRCVEGYREYCRLNGQRPDRIDCKEALLNPRTVRLFTFVANMHAHNNKKYEEGLGLRYDTVGGEPRFFYQADKKAFEPNAYIMTKAAQAVTQDAASSGTGEMFVDAVPRVCPAKQFIPLVWGMTVEACDQAGLFAFDEMMSADGETPAFSSLPLDLTKI